MGSTPAWSPARSRTCTATRSRWAAGAPRSAHARLGDRVALRLGDGTRSHATVVAIYRRELAFGEALLAPELAAGHQTTPQLGTILVETGDAPAVARAPACAGLAISGPARERPAARWPR